MTKPFRIAIAGLGTVGAGAVDVLARNAELIAQRAGRPIVVAAVSARNKNKTRSIDLVNAEWVSDATQLPDMPGIDCIVEVIGGAEGAARALVEKALAKGISVVTANKALIAHHGVALAKLAEEHNATLAFEAAVAGGIPIIKSLRDGLAANRFRRIAGILNGTCNYILTQMQNQRISFDEALKEAQQLGYAESDPSFDVDGIDTAHKLAILASLAFGSAPAIDQVHVEGIRAVTLRDMEFAHELGYRIKLLGLAEFTPQGIVQRVHPCMVPESSPLANVHGVYNAVVAEGDAVGSVFFEGRGAGAGPTASSVVADLMDIARGTTYLPFTLPVSSLAHYGSVPMAHLACAYYLRLAVIDQPGVLAEVTGIFRDCGISVRSFLQHSRQPDASVQVVITTHETTEGAMTKALSAVAALATVREKPYVMRIETL